MQPFYGYTVKTNELQAYFILEELCSLVTVLEEGEQRLLNCVPIHLPEDVMRLFD